MALDWRDKMISTLVHIGTDRGIVPFNQDKVMDLMEELGNLERGKPEQYRVGFAYALDSYELKGITQILNTAKSQWPDVLPELIQVEKKPEGSIHKNECVVSVKLENPCDAGSLATTINNYLLASIDYFDAIVVLCTENHDMWYDILIRYSTRLSKIYELLREVPWIKNVVTKSSRDFGKRTVATYAR